MSEALNIKSIEDNPAFVGRRYEIESLKEFIALNEAAILIVYGRRRVGKTELLEQVFRKRNIIKIEGVEGKPQQEQIAHVLYQLQSHINNPILKKLNFTTWTEVFDLLADYLAEGEWTLYFEEVQWLADYQDDFINELKFVWDNRFKTNPQLRLILCGSSPSFIINHIVHSKSLYNRSQYELALKPFTLQETAEFLSKHSMIEILDIYLAIGGIPEYLKRIINAPSLFLGLCKQAFTSNGFFVNEYQRIFISSLSNHQQHQQVIEYLSKRRHATRKQIGEHLKQISGGRLTALLTDLELCGFIYKYVPYNLKQTSTVNRYCIADAYLQFYYKFIHPIQANINAGEYNQTPMQALNQESYRKWLGYSFERWCRIQHRLFAKILGFAGVRYQSGAFFNRKLETEKPGYQIDLVFSRADKVIALCEIKYLQQKVTSTVIAEVEAKLALFPNPKGFTLQKVLIAPSGADEKLSTCGYFDRIITLGDILQNL